MLIRGFDFPDDLYFHVEHQVWARLHDDSTATIGITSLGIRLAGEIYMCRPKAMGSVVEQERSIAVVELAKAIVSVKSPVRGTVVEINLRLAGQPELVHLDPYGAGWLARIALTDFDADRAQLDHGDAVAPAMHHHAWLNQIE